MGSKLLFTVSKGICCDRYYDRVDGQILLNYRFNLDGVRVKCYLEQT
jgi:hypothetical protein